MSTNDFEAWVLEDSGFCIPRKGVYDDQGFDDDFDIGAAFDEVAAYLEEAGFPVVQQRPCSEYEDYISGWTNYTKWGFTYLEDSDEWEFEWELEDDEV